MYKELLGLLDQLNCMEVKCWDVRGFYSSLLQMLRTVKHLSSLLCDLAPLSPFMPSSWAHHIPPNRTGVRLKKARNSAVIICTFGLVLHFPTLNVLFRQCIAPWSVLPRWSLNPVISTELPVLACFSVPSHLNACLELHVENCCCGV